MDKNLLLLFSETQEVLTLSTLHCDCYVIGVKNASGEKEAKWDVPKSFLFLVFQQKRYFVNSLSVCFVKHHEKLPYHNSNLLHISYSNFGDVLYSLVHGCVFVYTLYCVCSFIFHSSGCLGYAASGFLFVVSFILSNLLASHERKRCVRRNVTPKIKRFH